MHDVGSTVTPTSDRRRAPKRASLRGEFLSKTVVDVLVGDFFQDL